MNDLERFKAIINFEKPDYVPVFGFPGAPGVSAGCMVLTHRHLVEQGMPADVGGFYNEKGLNEVESWEKYWGTTVPLCPDFFPLYSTGNKIRIEKRMEGNYEILEYETGAVIRQVVDNDITYSMPEFRSFHVRDRKSWEFYRDKTLPGKRPDAERIKQECAKFKNRTKPLVISVFGTWGSRLRDLMGPEKACTILYDDPVLAHEIIDYYSDINRDYLFPIIEYLRPEIVGTGEDMCYNHGMLISPKHFREFCLPAYKRISEVVHDCKVDVFSFDNDGNVMELVPLLEESGMNLIYPCEVKAKNDLFSLRERHPNFIFCGWLEKEVLNEGNEHMIEIEIMTKVPRLLEKGGYFPNADHGIQPPVSFRSLCKFMTLLHEVTGNPQGQFPRVI
jgi:uroporphyrinogen decarboxylase